MLMDNMATKDKTAEQKLKYLQYKVDHDDTPIETGNQIYLSQREVKLVKRPGGRKVRVVEKLFPTLMN
jgi:hypothetical protein